MPYLDETGLAYYNEKLQPWIASQPVKTLPSSLYPWTLTDKADAVTCWPVGGTELLPTVDFMFTETPPANGQPKAPDNPSTITGVSSITVTRCETVGVDSTDYTLPLGSTYYGGSIDLATGVMTVTWEGLSFNGSENIFSLASAGTSTQRLSVNMNTWYPDKLPLGGAGNSVSSHFDFYSNNSAPFGKYSIRPDGYLVINDSAGIIGSTVEEYKSWLASEYNSGRPVSFSYKLRTPYTVQLTPTQILSVPQTDKYTPRLNTVYTDAQAVQVGYVKSPIREEFELTQAIVAQGGNI